MKIKILTIITLFSINISSALGIPNSISITIIPSTIQFQLIDDIGNITGYNPQNNSVVNNIPNMIYLLHAEDSDDTTTPISKYNQGYNIGNKRVSNNVTINSGKYSLKLFGSNIPETYSIESNIFYYIENARIHYFQTKNLMYPNVVWTYEFNILATPPANQQIVLTKVSTPADLIKDLTTAGQLNYIGNKQFVSEIIKKAEALSLAKSDQKKEYTELLKEITEKYNKPEADEFVKQEAYTVLKEDLEYIISHL